MENKSHAFWAGLFVIVMSAALVVVLIWFNRDRSVRVPYDLVATTNVSGLSIDAAVRYRGLDVGQVANIAFSPKHPGQIVIRVLIDRGTPITHSTFATLGFQGVTGIAFVQMDDTGQDPRPLNSSVKQVATLVLNPGLFDQLEERGTALLQTFGRLADNLEQLSDANTRNQLLATAKSMQQTFDSARPALEQVPKTLAQLNTTLDASDQLIANLQRPDGALQTNLNRVGLAAERIDGSVQAISDHLDFDTLPRVNALTEQLRSTAKALDRTSGTLGSNPRSFLFGLPPATPDPGEAGFNWLSSPASSPSTPASR